MKKVGTSECKLFVAAHYAQKRIDTMDDDWVLVKKYRNPKGYTCRDLYCERFNIKAIVQSLPSISATEGYQLEVIEGVDHKHFLNEMFSRPAYQYVLGITNDGLVFYFENVFRLERSNALESEPEKYKPGLIKRLKECFGEKQVCDLKGMTVVFPKHDIDEAIRILEHNGFSYTPMLYDMLGESFLAFRPDVTSIMFDFPEYKQINHKQAEKEIFKVLSQTKEMTAETYARIKQLIKKVELTDLSAVYNIALGFHSENKKLIMIFEAEKSKRFSQNLLT